MMLFTTWRPALHAVVGLGLILCAVPAAQSIAQSSVPKKQFSALVQFPGSGSGRGFSDTTAAPGENRSLLTFHLLTKGGELQPVTATRLYEYVMPAGAAKPILTNAGGMAVVGSMAGAGGLAAGGGLAGGGGYGTPIPFGDPNARHPTVIKAYVFDEPSDPAQAEEKRSVRRPEIKVVVPLTPAQLMTSHSEAESGGGGMGGMASPFAKVQLLEESDAKDFHFSGSPGASANSADAAALKNIAELVRVDIWIRDAQARLRTSNTADDLTILEEHLRSLLVLQYDAQLAKQRHDIQRLREQIEQLHADLERRAGAKGRVVEVQLGQLVLEAQGLLSNGR